MVGRSGRRTVMAWSEAAVGVVWPVQSYGGHALVAIVRYVPSEVIVSDEAAAVVPHVAAETEWARAVQSSTARMKTELG